MAARSNLKKVVLELGGEARPAVVFDDADLEKTVAQTVTGIQFNSGQVCMANSRIYVQEGIAQAFVEAFNRTFFERLRRRSDARGGAAQL